VAAACDVEADGFVARAAVWEVLLFAGVLVGGDGAVFTADGTHGYNADRNKTNADDNQT
jgi:hypothetical protein